VFGVICYNRIAYTVKCTTTGRGVICQSGQTATGPA
jgi:hypothetical protein